HSSGCSSVLPFVRSQIPFASSGVKWPGYGGRGARGLTLSIHWPELSSAYVPALFAFHIARPSVVSVQQPTLTSLRTSHGATTTAAPARTSAVAIAVVRTRGSRQAMYRAQRIGRKTSRVFPSIDTPATAPRRT